MRMIILGLLLVSLMMFGCTIFGQQPAKNVTNTTTTPKPPPPKPPSFQIASPTDGQVYTIAATDNSTDVTLEMTTTNLVLQSPGGLAKMGQGYFKVIIDGGEPIVVTNKVYDIPALTPGNHTIEVDLYNNDNTPYSPALTQTVGVSVVQNAPAVYTPQNYTVNIGNFNFDPGNITVNVGDSVTWTNTGAYPRSATCFTNGNQVFDTKVLGPGKSATITFSTPMQCQYYSTTMVSVKGSIVVQPDPVSGQ